MKRGKIALPASLQNSTIGMSPSLAFCGMQLFECYVTYCQRSGSWPPKSKRAQPQAKIC